MGDEVAPVEEATIGKKGRWIANVRELAGQLRFDTGEGRIWLGTEQMALMQAETLRALRQELIESLGFEETRALMSRLGYYAGTRDAALAARTRPQADLYELLTTGGQLHALQGMANVDANYIEIDSLKGQCLIKFQWNNSLEAELCDDDAAAMTDPSCWMQTGYCSGYVSTIMGRAILAREVQCRGMGHACCNVIAKPEAEWAVEDARLPRGIDLVNGTPASNSLSFRVSRTEHPRSTAHSEDEIVGRSRSFNAALHKIKIVSSTHATVLFLGESGVGKSLFARKVHEMSERRDKPFIEVNCGAIPEQLIESELFGVERGAFSGAERSRGGRFEAASGGTIFLDEIGTLSYTAQAKLLRVLQNGEMERLGSNDTIKVDVRILAATNENLEEAVKTSKFREDLYYRINVFPITIPPLRERIHDIPLLIEYYLDKFCSVHKKNVSGISDAAIRFLMNQRWTGNIREFQNVLERSVITIRDGDAIELRHLSGSEDVRNENYLRVGRNGDLVNDASGSYGANPLELAPIADEALLYDDFTLADMERALVESALKKCDGNSSRAARLLGITRSQLLYKIKKIASG